MVFAETERLQLRALEKAYLPRIVEFLNNWEVAQWLVQVPYPYEMKDAEAWHNQMTAAYLRGLPEYFVIVNKSDNQAMGAVGLHEPNLPIRNANEIEMGYWLGKNFWGKGFMSEAVDAVIRVAFQRRGVDKVVSTTDPANHASQNVLRKARLTCLGTYPRPITDKNVRGSSEIMQWEITREQYERSQYDVH